MQTTAQCQCMLQLLLLHVYFSLVNSFHLRFSWFMFMPWLPCAFRWQLWWIRWYSLVCVFLDYFMVGTHCVTAFACAILLFGWQSFFVFLFCSLGYEFIRTHCIVCSFCLILLAFLSLYFFFCECFWFWYVCIHIAVSHLPRNFNWWCANFFPLCIQLSLLSEWKEDSAHCTHFIPANSKCNQIHIIKLLIFNPFIRCNLNI